MTPEAGVRGRRVEDERGWGGKGLGTRESANVLRSQREGGGESDSLIQLGAYR